MKKLFAFTKKIYLRIVKTEILGNNKYKFILRIIEENNSIDAIVDSKDEL